MSTTFTSLKRGFTMLELVFVIVILGIVASIGSSLIVQVYESYIVQRALHRTSLKAELAATQIVNRLTYRISSSAIGREGNTNNFKPIDELTLTESETHTTLEWIAYDNDSFSTNSTPGWSGFCDLNETVTTRTKISTPGSNLDGTNAIIGKLSNSTKNISNAAIIFAGHEYNATKNYIANCMGFSDNSCIYRLSGLNSDAISLPIADNPGILVMTDQYKLVWSAYAIVPTPVVDPELTKRGFKSTDEVYDLALHYNYQPWSTNSPSSYYNPGSSSRTLVTNVESFRFIGKGDTIRFKICVLEPIGDSSIRSCKEKAVIR